MTRGVDIDAAEALGVDFIGFIFVPLSPRSVTLDEAKNLRRSVRTAQSVGVFADDDVIDIERHVRELKLSYVQLHGAPDTAKIARLSCPVIQAFSGVPPLATLETFLLCCPYVLIDAPDDLDEADICGIAALPPGIRSRLFLAGGLTPNNVRSAVDRVLPFAVDTARGIEIRPGIKDHARMSAFFQSLS